MHTARTTGNDARAGFTFIEVMVTVALISILTVIAVPNFQSWVAHYKLRQATDDIAGALQLARLKAVASSGDVHVDFGPGAGLTERFLTVFIDDDGDDAPDNGEELTTDLAFEETLGDINGIRLPAGVFFGASGVTVDPLGATIASGASFNGNDWTRFRRNGTATGGFVFVRNNEGETYAVEVGTTGKVRTWRYVAGAWR